MRPIPPQERVCANRQLALLGAYDPANRLCDMKDILERFVSCTQSVMTLVSGRFLAQLCARARSMDVTESIVTN